MFTHRIRRSGLITAIATVAAGVALMAPSAAVAATPAVTAQAVPAASADAGWLRLGHFSPDTKAVDVRVSALSGGSVVFELSNVRYGDISPYQSLGAGTYTIAMIPAGSKDWTKVAISDTVDVSAAGATTVAAYGPTRKLKLKAFDDDLTGPAAGSARLRVIQASTITPAVDVKTSTGLTIAAKAREGSATPYAEVPAGAWTLQLSGTGVSDSVDVTVAAGSVTTLFVLDNADGGLTILPILDSAATPVVPGGGVQTGGGWLAGHHAVLRLHASAV